MANFLPSLIPSFTNFVYYFMSITSYLPNATMQSPPFGILGINNNNSRHTGNPPPKPGQQQGQLAAIPVMNPNNRLANAEEREEQENKENQNKVLEASRKAEHSRETACTLLITLMRLEKHFHPESMMVMMMTYSQTLCELHEAKRKR